MAGYILVAQKELSPPKPRGMKRYDEAIGLLDFLRELRQEHLPFAQGARLRVEGLEEVLFAAKPDYAPVALRIRQVMKEAANELQQKLVTVQVVFKGRFERGRQLHVVYRDEPLPIYLIFNTPTSEEVQGSTVYRVSLNLT